MQRLKPKVHRLFTRLDLPIRQYQSSETSLPKQKTKLNFFNQSKQYIKKKLFISPKKRFELQLTPRNPRTVYEYQDNISASLKLPVEQHQLNENLHNINNLIDLSKASILEHAARRVDLFFYTLIAYYKSNLVPELGWTKLQHGRGRHAYDRSIITEASHSSFTPSLIDNTLYKKTPIISQKFENLIYKTSLVCGTHFMDSLATTIELPYFVNEFDTELEETYHCREKSLKIIADVAKGKITPTEGLHSFLVMMQNTFTAMLNNKHFYNSLDKSYPTKEAIQSKLNLFALIKKGTLVNKWNYNKQTVNEDYLFLLLRLKPDEIKACRTNNIKLREILYNKYFEIQNEILSTPSEHAYSKAPT